MSINIYGAVGIKGAATTATVSLKLKLINFAGLG
jgi:hypothetical protein